MDKVIIVGVGVAIAVGTALYYLLTQEKPMKTRRQPSNRHSSPRSRSPIVTYAEVKPEPCRKREPVPGKDSTKKDNVSEISCRSEPDRESGKKMKISQENQDYAQSSQELTDNYGPIFTPCEVCEENANATFRPCKHKIFCYEHAEYYYSLAVKHGRLPQCPNEDCRQKLIDYY